MAFKMAKSKSVEPWYKKYEPTFWDKIKKNLRIKFQDFIYYLGNDLGWTWIDVFIDALCNIEVNLRLAKNKDLLHNLETGDVSAGPEYESWNWSQIPEDDLYCQSCPFRTVSKVAKFFYGEQSSGYCYYLNQGDFSFGHPTSLLWDGCKECGIKDDIDMDEEEIDEEYVQNIMENIQKEINVTETTTE